MGNKKLIMISSIPDSVIDEMKELSNLNQSFKLDEGFEQNLKKDESRWPSNQYLVLPRGCCKTGRLMKMILENDESDWIVMTDEHIEKSIERKKQLMQRYKVELIDMIFDLEDRNEFLLHNLLEVEKMYDKLKGEVCMNTAVSLPDKNNDEATKIAMGYKYYIFVGSAEGDRADMALLSEEEAEVIKSFFDNKITFYDEGYAGEYDMISCGPFDSKEEAVNGFIKASERTDCFGGTYRLGDPDDLVGEFKDMYKEEEE